MYQFYGLFFHKKSETKPIGYNKTDYYTTHKAKCFQEKLFYGENIT